MALTARLGSLQLIDRIRRAQATVTALVVALSVVSLVGCTAGPSVDAIPPFRQGVVTANQQSQTAFAEVNAMLREQQLDRVVNQPTLSDEAFFSALAAEDLAAWHRAFASIEAYAGKLETLLSPDRRTEVEGELRKLGADLEQRYTSAMGEELPPDIAAGFVKLGGLLVQLKAGQDAMVVIREVNPAVQDIFLGMAEAIGTRDAEGDLEGVRGTVWTAWTQQLGTLQVAFLNAGSAQKRRIAEQYLEMLGEREAHDRALASIRASILALGAAHSQLAQGDRVSAAGLIRIVQEEYKVLREEIAAMKAAREAAGGGQ
jgi:hypothetical protein